MNPLRGRQKSIHFAPELPVSDDPATRKEKVERIAELSKKLDDSIANFQPSRDKAIADSVKDQRDLERFRAANGNLPELSFGSRNAALKHFNDLADDSDLSPSVVREWKKRFLAARNSKGKVNAVGAAAGFEAAFIYVQQQIIAKGGDLKKDILISRDRGNHTFDVVAIIDNRLVVVEAKGGPRAGLGDRLVWINGRKARAKQGSRLYLADLLRTDAELRIKLRARLPELYDEIRSASGTNRIDYIKVHVRPADPAKGFHGDVKVAKFDLGDDPIAFHNEPPYLPEAQRFKDRADRNDRIWDRLRDAHRAVKRAAFGGLLIAGLATGAEATGALGNDPQASAEVVPAVPADARLQFSDKLDLHANSDRRFSSGITERRSATHVTGKRSGVSTKNSGYRTLPRITDAASGLAKFKDFGAGFVQKFAKSLAGFKPFVVAVGALGKVQAVVALVAGAWAVVQFALDAVTDDNPVGALLMALSVAITAIVWVVTNWGQVKDTLTDLYHGVLVPVGDWFQHSFAEQVVPVLARPVAGVVGAFKAVGSFFSGVFHAVMHVVGAVVKWAGDMLEKVPGFLHLGGLADSLVNWGSAHMADGGPVGGRVGSGAAVVDAVARDTLGVSGSQPYLVALRDRAVVAPTRALMPVGSLARTASVDRSATIDVVAPNAEAAFARVEALVAQRTIQQSWAA